MGPHSRVSRAWILIGTAAGLSLHGAVVPALLAIGVLERVGGDWTLRTVLLAATITVALVGARLAGGARNPIGRGEIGRVLSGAGVAIFIWLEIDFHLLRLAETTTTVGDVAIHAAGIASASLGFVLAERNAGSALRPEHGRAE